MCYKLREPILFLDHDLKRFVNSKKKAGPTVLHISMKDPLSHVWYFKYFRIVCVRTDIHTLVCKHTDRLGVGEGGGGVYVIPF